MRGQGLWPRILVVSVVVPTGCGDAVCQTEVFVAFEQTRIAVDVDDFAPGVQTNVRVRTSLRVGETVTLEVRNTSGMLTDTVSRGVELDGSAEFDFVTVPTPRVMLRAIGHGLCGDGSDAIAVDVL